MDLDGAGMGVVEWVMLGAAIAAVLLIYLFTRRNSGPNPWDGMDNADDELPSEGSAEAEEPELIVDPSVAAEWENFTPNQAEPVLDAPGNVDEISPAEQRGAPVLTEGYVSEPRPVTQAKPAPQPEVAPPEPAKVEQEKIIVLHVARREGEVAGPAIHGALQSNGLRYGPREVYHRIAEVGGRAESVFCVANMLKPGTLCPDDAEDLLTRGLVMFMQLPGPVDGNKAFQDMLSTAQALAGELECTVLDDKRLPLTRQAAQYLIDDIAEFERQHRLATV